MSRRRNSSFNRSPLTPSCCSCACSWILERRIESRDGFEASAAFQEAAVRLASVGRDNTQTAGTLFNNWGVALGQLGQPLEAEKVLKRAIDISRGDETESSVSPMLLTNYGRVLRDLGRAREALDYAQRGYSKAQQAGYSSVMNQSLALQVSIYRILGDYKRAADILSEAEARFKRELPAGHVFFAALTSERAQLARARGDMQAAIEDANQAVALAEASIKGGRQGSDLLPRLLVRRAEVKLDLHRPGEAATDAARALNLLQDAAHPGMVSSSLGAAHLALARAARAAGKPEEARTALNSATEQLNISVGPEHPDSRLARQLAADLDTRRQ